VWGDSAANGQPYLGIGITSGVPSITSGQNGSGGDIDLAFYTSNASTDETEQMRLTSEGYLGLGKTDPTTTMAILGDFSLTDDANNKRVTLEAGTGANAYYSFGEDSNERGWIGWKASDQKINIGLVSDDGTSDEALTVESDGTVSVANTLVKSSQPSFLARVSSDQTISSNTATDVQFDTEANGGFDEANNYSTSTHTFTAPTDGKYFFSTFIGFKSLPSTTDLVRVDLVTDTTGGTYRLAIRDIEEVADTTVDWWGESGSIVINMEAGQEARIQVYIASGTGTVDGTEASSAYFSSTSWFGGYFLG